ncbi:MAG: WD40 repeat domain-containing serine/threonine protein kinase [Pirellulaceae bacterium]
MNSEESSFPQDDRLNELVEEYLASARKPGARRSEIRAALRKQHPSVSEELEKRLRIVDGVLDAAKRKVSFSDRTRAEGGHSTLAHRENRLDCPHCGQKIRLLAPEVVEITCQSCGSFVPIDEQVARGRTTEIPDSIGGFRVIGLLGEGGFGTAYRAHDLELGRTVAIKVPRRGAFTGGGERERFLREARAAARLQHPNIVQVHSISDDPDEPFIVSELIEGSTLSGLIQGQRLDFQDTARIMAEVAEAVDFAHEEGIIHRDLKPTNILLDEDQKPFITDFGLASNRDAEVTMTIEGELLGTPAYMSPEQAAGKHSQLTRLTDVYSLGVILYRMLSGELPFRGSQRMLIYQVMYDDPKSPRVLNDRIPRDLETIALKALSKEPARRYESAQAFADDLRHWMKNEPILARPASSIGKLERWRKRNPWLATLIASTAGLILMLAIGASIWAYQASKGKRELQAANISNRLRLSEIQLSNGLTSLEQRNYARSLFWFTEAAATSSTLNGVLSESARLRIGMTRAALPKLLHFKNLDPSSPISDTTSVEDSFLAGTYNGNVYVVQSATGESRLLKSFGTSIQQIVTSPSGKRFAIRPGNKTVSLYNSEDLQLLANLEHGDTCRDIQFSPDGSQLASVANDGLLRVWDSASGEKLEELEHVNKAAQKVRFVTRTRLLTACGEAGKEACTVQAWDIGKTEPAFEPIEFQGHVHDLKLHANGEFAAVSTSLGILATIEIATGKVKHRVALASSIDRTYALPSGRWLSVLAEGTLQIRDQELRLLHSTNSIGPTSATCIDASGQLLAVGTQDGRLRVYWSQTLDALSPFLDCGPSVKSLDFEADNSRLKVGSSDGSWRLWDFAPLAPTPQIMNHDAPVLRARYSPSGALIASASRDGTVRLWDVDTAEAIATLSHGDTVVVEALFSPNGERLATFDTDGSLNFWNRQGQRIGATAVQGSAILCVAWSQDGSYLVSGGVDGSIKAWTPGSDAPLFELEHQDAVIGLTFSSLSNKRQSFASASRDGNVYVWNENGRPIAGPFNHGTTEVVSVEFLDDSNRLLTRAYDNKLRIWDPVSPAEPARVIEFPYWPTAAKLENSDRLYTAVQNGLLERHDNWESTWQYKANGIRFRRLSVSSRFSNDLLLVCTGMEQNAITLQREQGAALLIDGSTGRLLSPPLNHFGEVVSAELDRDGRRILTASQDHTLRIWSLQSADQNLAFLQNHASILSGMHLTDEGKVVATSKQELESRFARLRQESPELFSTTPAESLRWRKYLSWLQANVSLPLTAVDPAQ